MNQMSTTVRPGRKAEPSTSPNGGPAIPFAHLGVTAGPPSVS